MENNKKATKHKSSSKSPAGKPKWDRRNICLQEGKDSWRRVFNETLKCYEIYVRKSNVLVATGIGSLGDSFLIGALPVMTTLFERLLNEIKNGEVNEETYNTGRYVLDTWRTNFRKGDGLGGVNLLRLDSPEFNLGGESDGDIEEVEVFDI